MRNIFALHTHSCVNYAPHFLFAMVASHKISSHKMKRHEPGYTGYSNPAIFHCHAYMTWAYLIKILLTSNWMLVCRILLKFFCLLCVELFVFFLCSIVLYWIMRLWWTKFLYLKSTLVVVNLQCQKGGYIFLF